MADKTIKIGATPSGMLPPPPLISSSSPKQKIINIPKANVSENYINNMRTIVEANQDEEQNRKISNASTVDKIFAASYAFAQGSTTAAAINKNLLLKQSENSKNIDKEFKKSLSTTFIQEYMDSNQIPNNEKYFELINGASNSKHLSEIKSFIDNDIYMTNTVNNSLGSFSKGASMFIGELATHPLSAVAALPVIIPKSLLLAKGATSTMATMGSSLGMSYLANEMTAYGDPSMTLDQKVLGLGIGAIADLTATRMMVNKYRKADEYIASTQKAVDELIRTSEANARTKANFTTSKYDMSTNYKWSTAKENMAQAETITTKQIDTAEQPFRPKTIQEEVSSYKPTKQEPEDVRLINSGLSPEDFAIQQSKATQAVQELRAMIKSASVGVEKVQFQELEAMLPAIKEIGKVFPDGEAQLMKDLAKVTGNAIGQTGAKATKEVSGKTKAGFAFKLGKKKETFEARSARFDEEISKQEAKQKLYFGRKAKESIKAGKQTIEDIKVKQEVVSELSKVQKSLLKAETTREALTGIAGNEAKVEIKTVKSIDTDGDMLLNEEMQSINTNSLGGKQKVNVSWWKKNNEYDTEDIVTDPNKLASQSLQEGDFGRNMLRNLGKEVNYLYREMDFNGLLDVLTLGGTFGAKSNLFFASAKELAIGQGKNIGIMIKTKPSLSGKTNLSKPYISSAKEYIVKDSFEAIRNNIEEIIISKKYFDSLTLKDKKRLLSMAELKFVNDMDEYRGLVSESGKHDGDSPLLAVDRLSKEPITVDGSVEMAKLENDIATLSEKEAMLLSESEGYATSVSRSLSSSLARQKEIYQRMASATDEIMDELDDAMAMRIADDLPTKADKEEFGEALSKDLSEAFDTDIKVTVNEVKESMNALLGGSEAKAIEKGGDAASIGVKQVDSMNSEDRMVSENITSGGSVARKQTNFLNMKFNSLNEKLKGKIGELPHTSNKWGFVHDGSIYVKFAGTDGINFTVAHELGHLISHKFSSQELADVADELNELRAYFYKKQGKDIDVDAYKYETSDIEIIADGFALLRANKKMAKELAPKLDAIFAKYEDDVISNMKDAKPIAKDVLDKYVGTKATGGTAEELEIRNRYIRGDEFGWTEKNILIAEQAIKDLDISGFNKNLSSHNTIGLDNNGNIILDSKKRIAVDMNGNIVEADIAIRETDMPLLATDRIVSKEAISIEGSVEMAVKGDNVIVNGKLVPIALIVATSSTIAMADDGTTITASGVGLIVLASILGISPIQAYRKNQSIMREAKNSANEIEAVHEVAKIEADPIVKERKSLADKAYDFTKTGYISSYFTVEKYGTAKAIELLNQLVENPTMYSGIPADVLKGAELKTALGRINTAEHDNFNEWINEMNLTKDHLDSAMNRGSENNMLREFRELVSDAIDNPNAEYPNAVKAQALSSRGEFDKVLEDMITNGIAGAEEARKIKNYFPHYTKSSSIGLISSTEEGKASLINSIAILIRDGSGRTMDKSIDVATEWVKVHTNISTGVNISTKDADRFMNAMDSLGIDMKGISKEEIMMASSMSQDVMSRVKSRIPMKMSSFVPFKANIDGANINISLSDIFMRNSNEVIKKYMNESYGQIALKKAIGESYTSEHALRDLINSDAIGNNREVRDVLNMYVSAIAGKPLYDANTVFNRNIDIAKNLSYGKLLFATASMTPEFLKATWAIFKNHDTYMQGVKELRNIWKDIPANTALSEELSYVVMGTGTSAVIKEGSFKGIDSFTNVNEDIGGFAGRMANANKSTSLWLSRLIHADDAMKRLASIHNLHRLKDIANGTATMSVNRMKRYGIDQEMIDIVNKRLNIDDNGNIMSLGFNQWTTKEQNKFRAVMHQMNQQRSLEVMIGGIPKAFMDNPAGRLLSFLGSFSAQLYSTHFVGMFKSLDQEELANQITWLLGGMITTLAKDAAFGSDKEISDEELFTRTLMASPSVGLYSAIHLFANPIVPAMAADAMEEMTKTAKIVSKE